MASIPKRKKTVMTLGEKIKVLDALRTGESASAVGRRFNINESTVRSIKKQEKLIRESVAASTPVSAKVVSQVRNKCLEKTENALSIWLEDMSQKRIPISSALIRAKARKIFEHMKSDSDSSFDFQASKGWLENFKKRYNLHNIKLTGESASADHDAAKIFPVEFKQIIQEGGYLPQQVFNADETGLFWKKMPNRTFLSKSERSAPGFKAAKDRISLLFCANASGDFKVKPMMIYRSLNPRALKGKNKNQLPVFWRANKKSWVTGALFLEWFNECFIPEVKNYLSSANLDFKVLLVIDNAPGHPSTLVGAHPNIQVKFLPPNTTSLIQPLDQGVFAAFKLYYTRRCFQRILDSIELDSAETITSSWKKFNVADCIADIDSSLMELKPSSINACWKNLWPEVVIQENQPPLLTNQEEAIVNLAHKIGGEGFEDVRCEEIRDLIESHRNELNEKELDEITDETIQPSEESESENENENFGKCKTFISSSFFIND